VTRRSHDIAVGIASAAALVIVVLAVPVALVATVGWPLPAVAPRLDVIGDALTRGDIADATWLKALACVVWLAWTQLTIAIALEAVGAGRGRTPRRARVVAMPARQVAARLVVAITLLVVALSTRADRAAPRMPLHAIATTVTDTAPQAPTLRLVSAEVTAAQVTPSARPSWTVARRDTLWSIAESTLGDGRRYPEIFELNRGRPQPDGTTLERPDRLQPGWVLELPDGAAATTGTYTVRPGDTLTAIAATTGHSGQVAELFSQNAGVTQPDGGHLSDPDLIRPGWTLRLPAAPATLVPAPNPAADTAATGQPPTVLTPPAAIPAAEEPHPAGRPATAEPVGAGAQSHGAPVRGVAAVLAAGLALAGIGAAVDRLRRVQQRHRSKGRRIAMPAPEGAGLECVLRSTSDTDTIAALDHLLRLSGPLPWNPGDPLVRADADVISVGDIAGVRRWSAPRTSLPDGAAGASPAIPALVPLGTDAGANVLVDLEALPVLSVTGDDAAEVVAAIAVAAATAPWCEDAEVVLVDIELGLDVLPWVQTAPSLSDAIDAAEERLAETSAALHHGPSANTATARRHEGDADSWGPIIVVSAAAPDTGEQARLEVLGRHPHLGVAVVTVAEAPTSTHHAHVEGDRIVLDDDVRLRPHRVGDDLTSALRDLLDAAGDLAGAPPDEQETPTREDADAASEASTEHLGVDPPAVVPAQPGPEDLDVRVLGPLELRRGDEAIAVDRAKVGEAVTYLALHPEGADKDNLQAALWPEGTNAEGTWHQTMSRARRLLGDDANGRPHLPPARESDGRWKVTSGVTTDHERFTALVDLAETRDGEMRRSALHDALALVRGEPLTGKAVVYAWRDALAARIEAEVVDSAEALALSALEAGDSREAEWAARQGLLASPYDERLYRLLMRSADAAGNPAGVHRVLRELAAKLELDIEPLEGLHPETVELFERLTTRRGRASA
jgi:DNA-binding SARP family transcriptional activator